MMENSKVKNPYRVVCEAFDADNPFVHGTPGIFRDEDGRGKPHARVPLVGKLQAGTANTKLKALEIRCPALDTFVSAPGKKRSCSAMV